MTDSLHRGVATNAKLIGYEVLDSDGVGYTSSVIAAIEHAVAKRTALGIDIINLSVGHPILEPAATDPLVLAAEAVCRAGIVVVVSGGNCGRSLVTGEPGYGGITSPGNAAIWGHNVAWGHVGPQNIVWDNLSGCSRTLSGRPSGDRPRLLLTSSAAGDPTELPGWVLASRTRELAPEAGLTQPQSEQVVL